ncbi:hypothetical protein L1987_05092 [Smallanthus sonchifolius]|uniref:Uncharacterized protein n=1 Tax=Smallanthus sonchifolius TaxID=185202 RepID=A0ACB9JUL3_9ASTR|nr:hypothetical protein L1987_05092 [Smallanthus sonchifolius]
MAADQICFACLLTSDVSVLDAVLDCKLVADLICVACILAADLCVFRSRTGLLVAAEMEKGCEFEGFLGKLRTKAAWLHVAALDVILYPASHLL